jgi:predicted phage terminase large subunit-like protein
MTTIGNGLENQDAIKRAMCKQSLYFFLQEFWGEVSATKPVLNWHIQYLCEELEIVARRLFKFENGDFYRPKDREPKLYDLLINISPGSTKSTIVSQMFPAWCWVNDPTLRFMSGSYSGTLALEQADYTREIIRSAKFKRLFPEIQFRADAENKTNYKIEWFKQNEYGEMERQRGGNRLSCSPSGTATGFHADIIIIDDPINPNDANSATGVGLYNACDWIKSTLSTRKTEKDKTVFIMVMQRLNEADPSGMWIQEAKEGKRKIKHICLPGELTENVSPPALRKFYKDGLFDPVRLNRRVLEEQYNNLGPYGYAGQILQTPVPIGEGLFKVEKFEIVSSIQESDILEKIRYWDKAGTEGAGAFSVGVLFAKLKSGKFALLDVIRGQWSTEKRENIIKQTAQLDGKSVKIYIEQEGGSGGKESAEATIRNLAGYMVFIDLPKGDKTTRAIPYSVQVNSGNVILVANQWNRDYINECRHFPLGKYKDQVDASSAAFNMLFQEKRAGVWGSRNNHK